MIYGLTKESVSCKRILKDVSVPHILKLKKNSFSYLSKPLLFAKDVLQEGKKVIWPGQRDVLLTSAIVFVITLVFSIFFFVIDQGLSKVIQFILGVSGDV